MNSFLDLILGNILGATLLAVIAWVASWWIRRPAVRHALWMLVLIRLLLPPIWNIPIPALPAKVPQDSTPIASSSEEAVTTTKLVERRPENKLAVEPEPLRSVPDVPEIPLSEAPGGGFEWEEAIPATPTTLTSSDTESAALALPSAVQESETTTPPAPEPAIVPSLSVPAVSGWTMPFDWRLGLLAVWGFGTCLVFGLAIRRITRFQRALRDAVLAPESVQQRTRELAHRLGLRVIPSVWFVPGRVPPMIWMPGLRRRSAQLVVPGELFFQLDEAQRSALLVHELAHLRRGDPWVRWLELFAIGLYWWYPLLGWVRRQLRDSEEQCCDRWVVEMLSSRKAYATALVETVVFLNGPPVVSAPELASGVGPVRDLSRRINMIMRGSAVSRWTRFGILAMFGFAAVMLAFGPALTNAQPDRKGPPDGKGKFGKDGGPGGEGGRGGSKGGEGGKGGGPGGDGGKGGPGSERGGSGGPGGERGGPGGPSGGPGGGNPGMGGGPGGGPGGNDFQRARQEVEQARADLIRALDRLRQAEERLGRMNQPGGPGQGPGPGGPGPRDPGRRSDNPMGPGAGPGPGGPGPGPGGPGPGGPGPRDPGGRTGPGQGPIGPGGGMRDPRGPAQGGPNVDPNERRLEELMRQIEELRQELRRREGGKGPSNPGPGPAPGRNPDRGPGPGGPGPDGRPNPRPNSDFGPRPGDDGIPFPRQRDEE